MLCSFSYPKSIFSHDGDIMLKYKYYQLAGIKIFILWEPRAQEKAVDIIRKILYVYLHIHIQRNTIS